MRSLVGGEIAGNKIERRKWKLCINWESHFPFHLHLPLERAAFCKEKKKHVEEMRAGKMEENSLVFPCTGWVADCKAPNRKSGGNREGKGTPPPNLLQVPFHLHGRSSSQPFLHWPEVVQSSYRHSKDAHLEDTILQVKPENLWESQVLSRLLTFILSRFVSHHHSSH